MRRRSKRAPWFLAFALGAGCSGEGGDLPFPICAPLQTCQDETVLVLRQAAKEPLPAGRYTVRWNPEGVDLDYVCDVPSEDSVCRGGDDAATHALDTVSTGTADGTLTLHTFRTAAARVHVRVERDGRSVLDQVVDLQDLANHPNGRRCAPHCSRAYADVEFSAR